MKVNEFPSITPGMKLLRVWKKINQFLIHLNPARTRCEDCGENDMPLGHDGLCHFCAEDREFVDQRERPL